MEAVSLFVQPNPALSRAVESLVERRAIPYETVRLSPGDFLFREREDIRRIFYLSRGLVRILSTTPDGGSKTVFLHKGGTLLGFQTLQDFDEQKPSILDACALSVSEIYALDGEAFARCLRQDGDMCFEMTRYLFHLLALTTRESVNASKYPVLQRFAALLLTLSHELNLPQAPAVIPFCNKDLAEMLGVHVNSVTNAISQLRKSECVERRHSLLAITDFKKLKAIAEDLIADSSRDDRA